MKSALKSRESGLNIIIVGCGKVGMNLVEKLSLEGHNITIVDKEASHILEITNLYDVMSVTGNGASLQTLTDAGIENADLLIAVTNSDELNLLCCTLAKRFKKCAAIARVRTPDYSIESAFLKDTLGLAMIINPELEAALEISRILCLPSALEVNSFAHGQAEMISVKIPEGNVLDNMTVAELGSKITNDILICAVDRNDEITIPSGSFVLKSGDKISIVATRKSASEFFKKINFKTKQVRSTLIIGGGRPAYYLASLLIREGIEVKIIEQSQERCDELAELLPRSTVICGDGTDEAILKEEGIDNIESIVPLTGIDEENVMISLYAQQVSKAKVVTKINRFAFKDVISNLDLGSVVYPKNITSEAILAYVRARQASIGSNVETLSHPFNYKVEAIEFKVSSESKVLNIPLSQLSLKKDLLIAFISRGDKRIFPSGSDMIMEGDTVMIVTTHTGFTDIEDILA